MVTQNMERAQQLQFDADLKGPTDPTRDLKRAENERDRENARAMQALGGHGLIAPPRKPGTPRPARRPRATNR